MGAPWFRFYPTDYLADAKVRRLSRPHRSMLLDCWCWCSQEGSIPSDPKELSVLLGENRRTVEYFLQHACIFFEKDGDKMYSVRLLAETEKYKAKVIRLRDNASKGGTATQANAKAIAQANDQANSTEPEPEPEPEKDSTPLPPQGGQPSRNPGKPRKTKQLKIPDWQISISQEILEAVGTLKAQWADRAKGAVQPDGKGQPTPINEWPEVARRLTEITREGGDLEILVSIGLRAVKEWRAGRWIKAPQHFFGRADDAPWRALYSAELTNRQMEAAREQESA